MKKVFFILAIFLVTTSVFGQKKGLYSKKINEAYTWRTATTQQIDSFYFGLIPLQQINYPLYIRISIDGQTIDLYSSDNLTYNGFLINQTKECKTFREGKKPFSRTQNYQYFFEKKSLDSVRVKNIVHHIITSGLFELQIDTSTSGCRTLFFDCSSISVQSTINNQYHHREFVCPWGQDDSLQEKKVILEFYDLLKKEFCLDSLYKIFISKLPNGRRYSKDGYLVMYKMTKKESKSWEKHQPQRDYLYSIQDTVINYLTIEVEKQEIELKEINCTEDYYLTFDKTGKFKKVENYTKSKRRRTYPISELIKEKQEIKKCKKKMKEICKQIDLNSMNLKYDVFVLGYFDFEKKIRFRKIY